MSAQSNSHILQEQWTCPYFNQTHQCCEASISRMPVQAERQSRWCSTEDHDNCALFLSRMLRQSQSKPSGVILSEFSNK